MTDRERALWLWKDGQIHHERNELDRATELYRESIAVHPTAEAHTFPATARPRVRRGELGRVALGRA